ncbi:hypothetical protein [Candidatus Pelagibacter sp. HIMB1709]|uniref:hypothetical protein n=1 Tax=Candidatus Pelagibacter sp. HIMB1709 TaxID=3413367 RepID=UPI003F829576
MKKLLSIMVLSLLFSGTSFAAYKFQQIGIDFKTYEKSCKKWHIFNKKKWPEFLGEEDGYKVYNCWKPDTLGYGDVQVFKDNILVKSGNVLGNQQGQGARNIINLLIGLNLLTNSANSNSLTTNNNNALKLNESGVNMTGGIYNREIISGSNKICFYKTLTGEVALTIQSSQQCKRSLNQ